jgi:hypothetical protein
MIDIRGIGILVLSVMDIRNNGERKCISVTHIIVQQQRRRAAARQNLSSRALPPKRQQGSTVCTQEHENEHA